MLLLSAPSLKSKKRNAFLSLITHEQAVFVGRAGEVEANAEAWEKDFAEVYKKKFHFIDPAHIYTYTST
jgi:uncharacterized protein YfdQ (DUF2303 family)